MQVLVQSISSYQFEVLLIYGLGRSKASVSSRLVHTLHKSVVTVTSAWVASVRLALSVVLGAVLVETLVCTYQTR